MYDTSLETWNKMSGDQVVIIGSCLLKTGHTRILGMKRITLSAKQKLAEKSKAAGFIIELLLGSLQ